MIKKTIYFGNPTRLSVELNQLRIAIPGHDRGDLETVTSRPIEDIGMGIIDHPQIVITSSVLQSLADAGAAVVCCDRRHMPAGLMMHLENNSLQSERFRTQLDCSLPLKKQLWQQTVAAKILNQAKALESLTGERHDNMFVWSGKVKSGDSDNLEGRAAAYYWKTLFGKFPGSSRNRDGDEPNSMLNYGYAVLRAIVARALVSSGMHPSLGLFHKNKYNAYCLADDIMEPYRPYVDLMVFALCGQFGSPSISDRSVRQHLLTLATTDVEIEGKRHPLMVGVSLTTASLFKCYAGEIRKIRYPEIRIS